MKEFLMSQSNAARADEGAQFSKKTPAAKVKHGKVEIAIWPNDGTNGTFYTASTPTIRYQDEKGDFKDGSSFGRHDLLDLAEAAREAASKIRDLQKTKAEEQGRA
jgi:hypothetical protein